MTGLNLSDNCILSDEAAKKDAGFWHRQFREKATYKQKRFDLIFGVVLPVVCFFFDPLVFRSEMRGLGDASLGAYKPFAYILSFSLVMGVLAFLLFGEKLKWMNGFLSGLFFLGSAVSLAVGIFLFPFSLLGMIVLIGVLGFTPFFSAFVYARNAVRAYETAAFSLDARTLKHSAALSLVLSFCLPYLFNAQVAQGLKEMTRGDARTVRKIGARFWYIAPLVNFDPLVTAARTNSGDDAEAEKALAEVYFELTGEEINPPWSED